MHILLVEDNPTTAKSIELKLAAEGHNVFLTDLGEDAIELSSIYDYDLMLLDLDLPDIEGLEVLRALRANKVRTPVIVVTASSDVETKVKALSAGADDIICKPFHKAEMAARINAVVRRSRGHSESIIRTGNIALNLDTRSAEVCGVPVHLTPSEYKVLELLSLRKNTVLTKEMCLNHLYNGLREPEVKIIDVFVCKLRKKLAQAAEGDNQIETVWGGGYMLRDARRRRAGRNRSRPWSPTRSPPDRTDPRNWSGRARRRPALLLSAPSRHRGRRWQSRTMEKLFRFPSAVRRDPRIEAWFDAPDHEMRQVARPWFERLRNCGPDVRELLHDGHPFACVGDAAFAYVDAFSAHVNLGFFNGTMLDDPAGLLEGSGKRMRHVKVRWGQPVNAAALEALIAGSYRDIRARAAARD